MHCDFACLLYKQLKTKLSQDEVYAIMRDAVDTEVSLTLQLGPFSFANSSLHSMIFCLTPFPPPCFTYLFHE